MHSFKSASLYHVETLAKTYAALDCIPDDIVEITHS